MPPKLLPVNHLPQEEKSGCLAACGQMLLTYWHIPSRQSQLNRLFSRIDIGARFTHIVRLKQYGVQVVLQNGDERRLMQAIDKGLPPVIFVAIGELTSYWLEDVQHAVVVIGYDDKHFYVNDPAFPDAPKRVLIDELMLAWLEFDYAYALITR
jgi:ABC-type bacteriocin/lantibiotic exporter with double-glycine peptidase domain